MRATAASGRHPTRFRTCRSGSNAVEFALLAPFLCAFLFAILLLGLYLGIAHSLAQLTADTSRYAMVGRSSAERGELVSRWVARSGGSYPLLQAARLRVTAAEDEGLFTVSASYDASYLPIPLIAQDLARLPATIVRSSAVFLP